MQPNRHIFLTRALFVTFVLLFPELGKAQNPCYRYSDRLDTSNVLIGTFSLRDSIFSLPANIRMDYRIIGYSKPDPCSKRCIIFSVFTRDVEDNPYKCEFGAFYSTAGMPDKMVIKYLRKMKRFIVAGIFIEGKTKATIYFERQWVALTNE